MRVIVTGANGFIGQRLVARLIEKGALIDPDGMHSPITELVLVDRTRPSVPESDITITLHEGDLREESLLKAVIGEGADSLFHLAATSTMEAEYDPQTGLAINMLLPLRLLEACGRTAKTTRFVYPSSIAVFGGELPDAVADFHAQTPQTSQGTAKAMTELLVNDYSRRGLVDGRCLRLPVVLLRPDGAGTSLSDRIAALVHNPQRGETAVSPFDPATRFPVASVGTVAENLIRLHDLPADAFGHSRAINQPGLSITIGDVVEALKRRNGPDIAEHIRHEPDPALQKVLEGWPRAFVSTVALDPPLATDTDFDAILNDHYRNRPEDDAKPAQTEA